ncbi:MAG: VanZ family protein [Actinobacteria bacterium]|nr:VanZ family protein [Actinomycetota bacterium]
MTGQVLLGVLAVVIGLAIGLALFVPFVTISYRRRGRLSPGRLLLWLAALIYFLAIWTYTLLPLPDPDELRCVGAILDPMAVVDDIRTALASGHPLTHPAMLQLVFNVMLFAPLGFFVRVLGGRGILTALLVGLGLSLFIETTQLTGVWGLYPCAYRFFDVGDLMTNTLGAVLGSVAGLVVPRSHRGATADPSASEPRPVTRGRRALAMLCDGIGFWFVDIGVAVGAQLFIGYVLNDRTAMADGRLSSLLGTGVAAVLWLVVTLATGRSVGDHAVQLRYDGGPMPRPLARLLRWVGGVAGLAALGLVGGVFSVISSAAAFVACLLFFFTRNGRGLPGLLSGQELRDARESASADKAGV